VLDLAHGVKMTPVGVLPAYRSPGEQTESYPRLSAHVDVKRRGRNPRPVAAMPVGATKIAAQQRQNEPPPPGLHPVWLLPQYVTVWNTLSTPSHSFDCPLTDICP
jgi:hypothetical protein